MENQRRGIDNVMRGNLRFMGSQKQLKESEVKGSVGKTYENTLTSTIVLCRNHRRV